MEDIDIMGVVDMEHIIIMGVVELLTIFLFSFTFVIVYARFVKC